MVSGFRIGSWAKEREAERRQAHPAIGRALTQHGSGLGGDRSPLGAPPRRSPGNLMPRLSPGRASRDRGRRRYLRLSTALKRSTSRAGRNAGGVDARTARERGYAPHPREPLTPHQPAVTGRRPSTGVIRGL